MNILSQISPLRDRLRAESSVALVPTMGNLHEGHLELVRLARQQARCVAVSIFVNPLQFGPNEDFGNYPRTFAQDCEKLAGLADVVFAPPPEELYPVPQSYFVTPPAVADDLCGASRPGHFRGVATVVLKLFNLVRPDVAVFGKKDYQQLHILREMTRELNLPIQIAAGETARAADGLALSSRNGYLSPTERAEATRLYRNLSQIRASITSGQRDFAALEQAARDDLAAHGWQPDYVSLRHAGTLAPARADDTQLVALAAARLGSTRLIDNVEICLDGRMAL